ncbi:MAG: hypothetical protein WC325_05425 [Candidatus Bathyarchaeia archaeon]
MENFAEGCTCGYSSNMLERIGSLMEYNGQRMTTQTSLILAVVIGIFSISQLTNGNILVISLIIFFMLSGLGFYLIYRLENTQNYNMTLEEILICPTNFIAKWKKLRKEKITKENKEMLFREYLKILNDDRQKNMHKRTPKRKSDETCLNYLIRRIFAQKYRKYFYFIFIGFVFINTFPIIPWMESIVNFCGNILFLFFVKSI